jgi:predicted transcriptional regulator YdeE
MGENIGADIVSKICPTLHTVYYNYKNPLDLSKKGYDMLIGYMTEVGSVQDEKYTTIQIPAQDYQYTTVGGKLPDCLIETWMEINDTPQNELPRSYGYDLDMYNADNTEVTVAISVKKIIIMIKFLSIFYTGLWYILGISIYL